MIQQLQDELETERQEKDRLWEEVETLKAQAHASQRDHWQYEEVDGRK
jgi:hypothetical protein